MTIAKGSRQLIRWLRAEMSRQTGLTLAPALRRARGDRLVHGGEAIAALEAAR